MSKGIRISPKHGVNPCIPICVFCGKEKDEIALLGRLKGDAEAPMSAIIDYQPCNNCIENWSKGVALIKISKTPFAKNVLPITQQDGQKFYPTAAYHVVTPEAAKRIFNIDAENGTPIFLEEEVFDQFTENAKASGVLDEEGNIVQ